MILRLHLPVQIPTQARNGFGFCHTLNQEWLRQTKLKSSRTFGEGVRNWFRNLLLVVNTLLNPKEGVLELIPDSFPGLESSRTSLSSVWFAGATPDSMKFQLTCKFPLLAIVISFCEFHTQIAFCDTDVSPCDFITTHLLAERSSLFHSVFSRLTF